MGYKGIYLVHDSTGASNTYAASNTISNNTITGGDHGIDVAYSESNTIFGNIINGTNEEAIDLDNSDSNIISNNTLTNDICDRGINLDDSSDCVISNNTIVSTAPYDYELVSSGIELDRSDAYIDGNKLTDCVIMPNLDDSIEYQIFMRDTTITTTNTVNGQPIYLFKDANMHGASVPTDAGELILYNVTNAHVTGLNLNYGFVLAIFSSELTIDHNSMRNGSVGILLLVSERCSIIDNEYHRPSVLRHRP